jgi:hypothetical protein
MKWRERTREILEQLARTNPGLAAHFLAADRGFRAYAARGLLVKTSTDGGRRHLSISHPRRYPTWDEIRDARYDLMPDVPCMAMILPPKGDYVNYHPNCFHLWEIDQPSQTMDGTDHAPTGAGAIREE